MGNPKAEAKLRIDSKNNLRTLSFTALPAGIGLAEQAKPGQHESVQDKASERRWILREVIEPVEGEAIKPVEGEKAEEPKLHWCCVSAG